MNPDDILKSALQGKQAMDGLMKQIGEHSHYSDSLPDLDMTIEEFELARRFPVEYDKRVNGITHIHVKDGNEEVRYVWKDGSLVNVKEGIF